MIDQAIDALAFAKDSHISCCGRGGDGRERRREGEKERRMGRQTGRDLRLAAVFLCVFFSSPGLGSFSVPLNLLPLLHAWCATPHLY